MATKYIHQPQNTNTLKNNRQGSFWYEMEPFVKFGIKALGLMAGALIAIVKAIPRPSDDRPTAGNRVIKIK